MYPRMMVSRTGSYLGFIHVQHVSILLFQPVVYLLTLDNIFCFCTILPHVASAGDTDVNVFVVRMQGLPYKAKEEDIVSCCCV